MIEPHFASGDDDWVNAVGRYIVNMGAVELATRILITLIEGSDKVPIFNDDLSARIGFIRRRFPRSDQERHAWAMSTFELAAKHVGFRNIIAHSALAMTSQADGSIEIQGIMNLTPKSAENVAHLVSLEELLTRVNESAVLARGLLEMQNDFARPNGA